MMWPSFHSDGRGDGSCLVVAMALMIVVTAWCWVVMRVVVVVVMRVETTPWLCCGHGGRDENAGACAMVAMAVVMMVLVAMLSGLCLLFS